MEQSNATIDSDELFHLALKAMEQEQTEHAIVHLKQLLDKEPDHGRAHYLLGALHAEIGMYQRAIEEIQHAVELEPDIPTAHFQLGLLHATSGNPAAAKAAWEALDGLGENEPLYIFKCGLVHLLHDELDACCENLNKGIRLNQTNPALNKDMQRILQSVNQLLNQGQNEGDALSESLSPQSNGKHILLNAYKNNDFENDVDH